MSHEPTDITELLAKASSRDPGARNRLWSCIYDELYQMASRQLCQEHRDHTLRTTDLIHEAYLRLVPDKKARWENRRHFFGAAAEAMRRILVEHGRRRRTAKRGGGLEQVPIEQAVEEPIPDLAQSSVDVESLSNALEALEHNHRHLRKAQVVKLRFFAGLTIKQTAELLDVSPATVENDWLFAKTWLYRQMGKSSEDEPRS